MPKVAEDINAHAQLPWHTHTKRIFPDDGGDDDGWYD